MEGQLQHLAGAEGERLAQEQKSEEARQGPEEELEWSRQNPKARRAKPSRLARFEN
jgi:sulfate-transporting ATPase